MAEETFWIHPDAEQSEVWPGPEGYPWAETGIRLWTREGLLKRVGPDELLCTWTTGGFTEPGLGNFTMIARSEDNGRSWQHAGRFAHPTRGLFTTELFVPRDGEVHAFLQTYDTGEWMAHQHSYRVVSTDGGRSWSGPHSIPGGADNVWANRGIVHSSGRWLIPVAWAELNGEEWAPPTVGRPPGDLQVGTRKPPHVELPFGVDSALRQQTGNAWCHRNHRYCCGVLVSDDDGSTFRLCGRVSGGVRGHLMEPQLVECADGAVIMLIRSMGEGVLLRSESRDRGETWSDPVRTGIPNPSGKVLVLKSRDGRIFLVHNPRQVEEARMQDRNPLSLWVSDDEMATWSRKVDLVRRAPPDRGLNYPNGYLDEERSLLDFVWEDGRTVYRMRIPLDIGGR